MLDTEAVEDIFCTITFNVKDGNATIEQFLQIVAWPSCQESKLI